MFSIKPYYTTYTANSVFWLVVTNLYEFVSK